MPILQNEQPEIKLPSEAFATGDFLSIFAITEAAAEAMDAELYIVNSNKHGRPDWKNAAFDSLVAWSGEPADMTEAERIGFVRSALPGCDFESTFVFYLADGYGDRFLIRQLAGASDDIRIAYAILAKRFGFAEKSVPDPDKFEPDPSNDNREFIPVPAMHPDPFSPAACGGLMGEITEWITRTAIVPSPELSLASSVALLAGIFGRFALTPLRSGVNVYLTTLLSTAGGKGHPPKAIRAIADRCGQMGAVTNGDPTSYAAIERMLRKNISTVVVFDEFGLTLQDVNAKHRNSVAASIRKFLLAVYDQADSKFDGRIYASADAKSDEAPLNGPALTVLGVTTVATLYAGLSADSVSDGFLNRFCFIEGKPHDGDIKAPGLRRDGSPPADLVARLQAAVTAFPRAGNLPTSKIAVAFDGDEAGDAYKRWAEIFLWQHHASWQEAERNIIGRAAENTLRLATLRAISRNAGNPVVAVEDVEWGWAIVYRSIRTILDGMDRHMAASPAEALRKAILAVLRDAPDRTMAFSTMLRKKGISGADMRELESALSWLVQSGEIIDLKNRLKPGNGSKFRYNEIAIGVATA